MSGWAAVEILKSAASYAVSPAYHAKDIFWSTLGYDPGTQQTVTEGEESIPDVCPPEAEQAECPLPSPTITVSFYEGDVTNAFADFPSYEQAPANAGHKHPGAVAPLDEDPPSPPPSPPMSPRGEAPIVGAIPNLPPFRPTSLASQKFSDEPIHRPLSSILEQFSYRASQRLSSLELFPEGTSLEQVMLSHSSASQREPTEAEKEIVLEVMAEELEQLSVAVQLAKDEEAAHVVGGTEAEETYFDSMSRSFVDVDVDASGGIDTVQWLEAVESIIAMFEIVASAAATFVTADIREGLRRVRARADAAPTESATLQELVQGESSLAKERHLATDSLEWHIRGLRFLVHAMRLQLVNPSQELSRSFTLAWDAGYSRHFGWMARPLFKVVIHACPSRETFWKQLGPRERATEQMDEWLDALEDRVGILERFYEELDDKDSKL